MGSRKYGPLKPKQIEKVLKAHGFQKKPGTGSDHDHWEGYVQGIRRVVTIPQYSEIGSPDVVKSIIQQSGLHWQEFRR